MDKVAVDSLDGHGGCFEVFGLGWVGGYDGYSWSLFLFGLFGRQRFGRIVVDFILLISFLLILILILILMLQLFFVKEILLDNNGKLMTRQGIEGNVDIV